MGHFIQSSIFLLGLLIVWLNERKKKINLLLFTLGCIFSHRLWQDVSVCLNTPREA